MVPPVFYLISVKRKGKSMRKNETRKMCKFYHLIQPEKGGTFCRGISGTLSPEYSILLLTIYNIQYTILNY